MPTPTARERRLDLRVRAAELLDLLEGIDPGRSRGEAARAALVAEFAGLAQRAVASADEARAAREPRPMLTQGEDVAAHALARRGWSISAIARHLERDRKTVRAYVRDQRQPGVRVSPAPDPIAPFAPYLAARFADDPHLWLTALHDEVVSLGYPRSYPSFVRAVGDGDNRGPRRQLRLFGQRGLPDGRRHTPRGAAGRAGGYATGVGSNGTNSW